MNENGNRYKSLTPDLSGFDVYLWAYRDADAVTFRKWCTVYIGKMLDGPVAFWEWYQEQRGLYASGELVWDVAYPHEIFPVLQTPEFADFYEVTEF